MNSGYPAGTCPPPHARAARPGLPRVPTPPNLYHPALALLEGATLSCWVLGWVLGWAGSPPPARAAKPPSFFLCDLPRRISPLSLLPLHLTPASPIHHQRRFHPPQPVTAHPASRQDHSSAPPVPIWPLQPSYPQHHLVYSMTCTSTPMNCIAPHSQVDTL